MPLSFVFSRYIALVAVAAPLLLVGCSSPSTLPEEAGQTPPDFVLTLEETIDASRTSVVDEDSTSNEDDKNPFEEAASADETDTDETEGNDDENPEASDTEEDSQAQEDGSESDSTTDTTEDDNASDEVAEVLSQELAAKESELEALRAELAELQEAQSQQTTLTPEQEGYIAQGVTMLDQPEYAFGSCGSLSSLAGQPWYGSFRQALNGATIRFANGFLEAGDMYGGCYSTQGQKAFFLGAQRGGTNEFRLIQYDAQDGTVEEALLVGAAKDKIVTTLGRREGSSIVFGGTDGSVIRYYYDANVAVVE